MTSDRAPSPFSALRRAGARPRERLGRDEVDLVRDVEQAIGEDAAFLDHEGPLDPGGGPVDSLARGRSRGGAVRIVAVLHRQAARMGQYAEPRRARKSSKRTERDVHGPRAG